MEPELNRLSGRNKKPIHSILNSVAEILEQVKTGYHLIIRGTKLRAALPSTGKF